MNSSGSIGWQEAVARLAGERTRAATAAGLLKKHGDAAAISRGQLAYGEAKAEADAVIAGLIAALALAKKPSSVHDLETRLARGVAAREAFSAQVIALVPVAKGERDGISDLLGGGKVLSSLIEAVKELLLRRADAEALTRKTIQTQVEAAKWPDFALIPPAD